MVSAVGSDNSKGVAFIAATLSETGQVMEGGEVVKTYSNSVTVEYMAEQHKGAWKLSRASTVPPVLG